MALGYEHTVELCRTRPAFERFASLSLSAVQNGIWQSRQLFLCTPTSLHAVFADPVQSFVQVLGGIVLTPRNIMQFCFWQGFT